MKKFFSMLMAVALVLSLSVGVMTPASAISYSGNSASSSSGTTSTGTTNKTAAYISDVGTLSNIPVKIYAFTTSSSYVTVVIGNSTFSLPVTHKQVGSRTVSTISGYRANLVYGFGNPYDVKSGAASINITVSHFGNSVPTHSFKANGSYNVQTAMKVAYPTNSSDKTQMSAKSTSTLNASAEGGYYTTTLKVSARDSNTTLIMKTSYVAGLWSYAYTRHNMKLINNALLSGKWSIYR